MVALVSVSLKKGMFWIIKKSAFLLKKGWFLSKSQRKGGLFLHPENTDGSPVIAMGVGVPGALLSVWCPLLLGEWVVWHGRAHHWGRSGWVILF